MPTTVSYDGKKLVPAPLIGIDKSYYKIAEENLGSTFQLNVQGTLVSFKGAPNPSGDYTGPGYPADFNTGNDSRLRNILRQQEVLREMFSNDFRLFEVQSADGSAPLKCRPRILSINFEPDIWFNTCKYSIQMEAPELSVFGSYHGNNLSEDLGGISGTYLLNASETWNTEYDEERDIFLLNHGLSAQGRTYYDLDGNNLTAIGSADRWIASRMGPDVAQINEGLTTDDFTLSDVYDYVRTRQVNTTDGSIDVNESWILSNKPYTEEYTVNVDDSEEGKQISVQGSIQGLSKRTYASGVTYQLTKWSSASDGWDTIRNDLYSRALSLSQGWVNPSVLSYSVGYNQLFGNIQYNYTYNDAPPNIIDGARFERINVNDDNPTNVIAIIPILGRAAGPIIQSINTNTERRRNVTIEVALTGVPITTVPAKLAYLANYRDGVRPNWGSITGVLAPTTVKYIEQDQETFDVNSRRYSKVVTWVY